MGASFSQTGGWRGHRTSLRRTTPMPSNARPNIDSVVPPSGTAAEDKSAEDKKERVELFPTVVKFQVPLVLSKPPILAVPVPTRLRTTEPPEPVATLEVRLVIAKL